MKRGLIYHAIKLLVAIAVLSAGIAPVHAADQTAEPLALMLVATPELDDPIYGGTVLVASPLRNGQFLGFIINKPTITTLAEAFPQDGPCQKVTSPIYLGGPAQVDALFALVQSKLSPGVGSIQLAPDLFVALDGDTVDHIIAYQSEHARFVRGAVIWQPGELESEIKRGAWYADELETGLMMSKEAGKLWKELVERMKVHRESI